jgi:glycosyltransferase involved in cell wall biosynthesis
LKDKSLRILHGPVNVGNQPYVLSRHERELGARSSLVVNYGTWLEYQADRTLGRYGDRNIATRLRRLQFGLTAPFRYDVLHFYFGRTFLCWDDYGPPNPLWFADLRLAKRLGRRIFMTLQGCDVRISRRSAAAYAVTPCHLGNCASAPLCRATIDDARESLIADVLPYVDRSFVLNPELAQYVPGAQFLPYASVDVDRFVPAPPSTQGRIRIVHAPSDEGIKGSPLIVDAIEQLKGRYPIDLTIVKGVPHAKALELYRSADLVIDQVLTGWYGGLAVEAMALAKPVACFIRDEDLAVIPYDMRRQLPLVRVHPQTLAADLEAAIANRESWPAWGEASREFVLRWHHPRRIASAMLRSYERPELAVEVS